MKYIIIIYLLFLILPIIEIYLNLNETDFPEYHEKRVKYNICIIFLSLIPFYLLLFSLCGPCCLCLYTISLVIILIAGIYYEISSFYLYFAYDGSKRIKSRAIKIMMWISVINFLNFILGIFWNCNSSHSSASATDSEDKESDFIEMKEEQTI